MSEQSFEYNQYAPQTGGRLFSSSMFGFNKEEVLEYLDELADENYQRQESADSQIHELTQRIHHLEASIASHQQAGQTPSADTVDKAAYEESRQHVFQLQDDLDIAKSATQQAEEELAEIREQLFNSQQENNWLREEFQKTDVQISDLRRQLDETSQGQWVDTSEKDSQIEQLQSQLSQALSELEKAQQEKQAALAAVRTSAVSASATSVSSGIIADANAEAQRIRAIANDEKERIHRQITGSAGGLAKSITNLRGELSSVEGDVSRVLEDVQTSLSEILSSLGRTEQSLNVLGVQVERFPTTSPSVQKPPQQQVVYFRPTSQDTLKKPAYSQEKNHTYFPETYGRSSFRSIDKSKGTAAGQRPLRPAYNVGPTAQAQYWAPEADSFIQDELSEGRIRALTENLADTLIQMLT